MTTDIPISLLIAAFSGALLLLVPHLSPRGYFFAITVPPDFRSSGAGRACLRRYYAVVLCGVVIAAVVVLQVGQWSDRWLPPIGMLVPALFGMLAFLYERSRVARLAPPAGSVREADLSAGDDRLPRWIALALPPYLFLLAAAAWLRAHWDEIPARFPIHWDIHNLADRWADKSPRAVYGPLVYGGGALLLLILMTIGMFYGARRGRQRNAIVQMMVATNYFLALMFCGISLMPVMQFPPGRFLLASMIFPLLLLLWIYRLVRDPKMPADHTPDRCWYLGALYINAEDPAIFVQKRIGFGYTVNMGNRLAWLFLGGFAALMFGLVFTLPR